MEHPEEIGDRSTLAVIYGLRELGYDLLDNTRYDLVIENGMWQARIQCKDWATARQSDHLPHRQLLPSSSEPKDPETYYVGEIDFFRVCPENGAIYLIPITQAPTGAMATLRVNPPRNGQRRRIRYASTFEIARLSPCRWARTYAGARRERNLAQTVGPLPILDTTCPR